MEVWLWGCGGVGVLVWGGMSWCVVYVGRGCAIDALVRGWVGVESPGNVGMESARTNCCILSAPPKLISWG